jgi:hypothetical protein
VGRVLVLVLTSKVSNPTFPHLISPIGLYFQIGILAFYEELLLLIE